MDLCLVFAYLMSTCSCSSLITRLVDERGAVVRRDKEMEGDEEMSRNATRYKYVLPCLTGEGENDSAIDSWAMMYPTQRVVGSWRGSKSVGLPFSRAHQPERVAYSGEVILAEALPPWT